MGEMNQTCKACGYRDKFDFTVPDEVWKAVVPPRLQNRVVCLSCFDNLAHLQGINYAAHISVLYFAGDGATLRFHTASAVPREID